MSDSFTTSIATSKHKICQVIFIWEKYNYFKLFYRYALAIPELFDDKGISILRGNGIQSRELKV
jgi:hypothetical protein